VHDICVVLISAAANFSKHGQIKRTNTRVRTNIRSLMRKNLVRLVAAGNKVETGK